MRGTRIHCVLGRVKDRKIWNKKGLNLKLCHDYPDSTCWRYFLLYEYNNKTYEVINAIDKK